MVFRRRLLSFDAILIAAVFLISSWLISRSAQSLSATFDEPFYFEAGLTSWRTGSNKLLMKAGTMPLPVELVTLPLYLIEKYRHQPYQLESDFGEMLPIARRMTLIFWLIALVYGWRIGNLLAGPWAGRCSVLLLATEPNLLAHAGLATTDLAVTAGVLSATYHFLAGRNQSWRWRVLVPGIAYGFALLCKASALAFVPLIWAVIGFRELYLTQQLKWRPVNQLARDFAGQLIIALVVTFIYCGSEWKTERTFVEWAQSLPEGSLKSVMQPISTNLKIFTNAGEALAQQIKHNFRGHGAYIYGEWHQRAVWYYFPVALAAKLTVPTLILVIVSIKFRRQEFFSSTGWAALALFLFSLNCRVQIGIRLMLPLIAILTIACAVALAPRTLQERGFSRLRSIFLFVMMLWQLTIAVTSGPDRLRYFNPLFGGSEQGHKWLSDSNVDWGQGLVLLKNWQQNRDEVQKNQLLPVWYYGSDPRIKDAPFKPMQLHQFPVNSTSNEMIRAIDSDYFAVSSTLLFGDPYLSPASHTAVEWLKQEVAIDRVGPFFIFKIR